MRPTIILLLLFSFSVSQTDNPCNDERFLRLKDLPLNDMSDREYDYFLKKEEECKKYNSERKVIESIHTEKDVKKTSPRVRNSGEPYIISLYASFPLIKLTSVKGYDNYQINGLFLQTPISIELGKLRPYLVLEYRNYIFSNTSDEPNVNKDKFGGLAYMGGVGTSVDLFRTDKGWFSPHFSFLAGQSHAGQGLMIDVRVPVAVLQNSPVIMHSSARLNIVQKGPDHGTGWIEMGFFIGFPIYPERVGDLIDDVLDMFSDLF